MAATTLPASAGSSGVPWDFVSTLIWQVLVFWLLVFFRPQIRSLLERVASVRAGGTEISFQPQTEEASKLSKQSPKIAEHVGVAARMENEIVPGPDGFLESSSVERLVAESKLVGPDEKVKELLLLFATQRQRTWLVATDERLFFVLDDQSTRAAGRLIQRVKAFSDIDVVRTKLESETAGVLYIGEPPGWYYSRSLFPNAKNLEKRVRSMIGRR